MTCSISAGDGDVALDKVGVVEDFAEDALGEEVLDEHFFHSLGGKVGIEGVAADFCELVKGLHKSLVGAAFLLDDFQRALRIFWNAQLELFHRFAPLLVSGWLVLKEQLQNAD